MLWLSSGVRSSWKCPESLFVFPPAPAMWHCWPGEPGSHTELGGRLACRLSPAEENNWWRFAHSPKCYLTATEHCNHSCSQWCHPEGFWEDSRQGGVADLGWWHRKQHHFSSEGHQWDVVENNHPAHRACEVICAACSPCCVGPGVQTILSWRNEHRIQLSGHVTLFLERFQILQRQLVSLIMLFVSLWNLELLCFSIIQGRLSTNSVFFPFPSETISLTLMQF